MQVLLVSNFFPVHSSRLVHGVFQRLRMFADAIKQIAEIDALFYVRPDLDLSDFSISKMQDSLSKYWDAEINLNLCKSVEHTRPALMWKHYGSRIIRILSSTGFAETSGTTQIKAFEARLHNKPDKIFVHRLSSMGPILKSTRVLPNVYLDLDDIAHLAFIRNIRQIPKWYKRLLNYTALPALCWGESRAIRLAHRTFVCSDADRDYLSNRWRLKGVAKVPNAVNIPEPQPITSEQTLLFLGSYFYKPNIDAAEFLIDKIWPRVYKQIPTAQLIIAGTPAKKIRGYGKGIPGVHFPDFVEDLDELYRRSRVVCAPILSGGGTRVKIIEAAAYGKPIVSTRMGAEGLQMCDDCEILIRDDPKLFAEACTKLLTDLEYCNRLGSAARATVVKEYDRDKIISLIQKYFKNEDRTEQN